MARVLVADDATALAEALDSTGHEIQHAADATSALKQFDSATFECVVARYAVSGLDGVALLRRVREDASDVTVVLLVSDLDHLRHAATEQIDHVLPYDTTRIDDLAARISQLVSDRRITRELDRHRRLKSAVCRSVQAAVSADTAEEIERAVCETLVGEGCYNVAWTSAYDEDRRALVPRAAAGIDVTTLAGQPVADDLESAAVDVHVTNGDAAPSTATVTLHHDGSLHGVLRLSTDRAIQSAERDLLETLGTVVATEIESTRNREVGPETEVFSGVLSHELRNCLQIAQSQLQLARDEHDESRFERVQTALDRIERLADEAAIVARQTVHPDDLTFRDLAETASAASDRVDDSRVTLAVADSRPVEAHHDLLEILLENLIRNSAEHGSDDVRVGALESGFYVEDSGPGIPAEDRDRVFEWGYTTDEGGTGFGLAIVDRIATAHGWECSLTEGDDGGVRFEFSDG